MLNCHRSYRRPPPPAQVYDDIEKYHKQLDEYYGDCDWRIPTKQPEKSIFEKAIEEAEKPSLH